VTLKADGERMIPENYMSSLEDYVIYLMHVASYEWAAPLVRNKSVLDFGCGTGYGSAELSFSARSVEAVDSSCDAINHASCCFPRSNLRFSCIDPRHALPFPDGTFDTVVSFQVIEHVVNDEDYIAEAHRVLAPGGRLLLITPNRAHRLFPRQRPWNRWHVREYDQHGLSSLASRYFAKVDCLGMTGDECFTGPEIKRCHKMKWASLPFTLPIYPDTLRIKLLNMVHRARGARSPGKTLTFDFDAAAVRIVRDASPSLNLVISATR
jgi:SAM-dependent methyltransferase